MLQMFGRIAGNASSGGRRRLAIAAVVAAGTIGGSTVALADQVYNNLDGSIDAAAEQMALNVGGVDKSTTFSVNPNDPSDLENGCNFKGAGIDTLTANVTSSNPAVATVGDSVLTFTGNGCGVSAGLSVHPVSAGTSTITLSQGSINTTDGTYSYAAATFVVTVSGPANTAPSVSITGVGNGASYNKGSVPSAVCNVTDAEDGVSSFPATLGPITGPYASDGIGSREASCAYIDAGGLTASSSVTYSIVDPTPPAISHVLNPASADGANGWYTSDVSLAWTVAEPESPNSVQATGCVDQSITVDQVATTYSCSATSAGGAAGPSNVTIKRDATAPANIQFVGGPAAGGNYFPITVPSQPTCSADDATSGVAGCVVTGYSAATGSHTMTATATDNAGNATTVTRTYNVRVFTLSGFFAPVDMGGVVNTVKGGSTVPLKFTVVDEGVVQTSTSVVATFRQTKVNCTTTAVLDDIEIVSTGGTALRYDTTGAQFIQNWQTPKLAGNCYVATVTFIDGQSISANFKLK
ncbi:MAG: hypothetical protein QOJ89_2650 [bacterium]|jgi:hypothetical protein